MKIGITGINGVLGSALKKKLKNYSYIKYVKGFNGNITKKKDIQNWLNQNDFDAIFHFAAIVSIKKVNSNPVYACNVNLNGTSNLIESLKTHKKNIWFFFASTSHVYKPKLAPIKESDEICPQNIYAMSKYLAENILISITANSKINLCIGRIFSFYDKSQSIDFLYSSFKNKFKKEKKNTFLVSGLDNKRDFLSANQVVSIIFKLFKNKAKGIYNIGSGKPTTVKNFIKKLTKKKIILIKKKNEKKNNLIANIDKLNFFLKNSSKS